MTRILKADRHGTAHVPAQVVDAHAQARAITEEARNQARAVTEAARQQASAITEAAQQRAAAIERAARERGEADGAQAAATALAAATLEHARACEQALAAFEPQAVEVAMRAARTLVGQELATRPEAFAALVGQLLRQVRGASSVELRVHPADRAPLLAAIGQLPAGLSVVEDATLERGDCLIDSDIGRVDGRLSVRVDALLRALEAR